MFYVVYEIMMIVDTGITDSFTCMKHGECIDLPDGSFTKGMIRGLEKRMKEAFLNQKETKEKGLKDCYVTLINWIKMDEESEECTEDK